MKLFTDRLEDYFYRRHAAWSSTINVQPHLWGLLAIVFIPYT